MGIPPEVIELENRSLGRRGEPTLARACESLIQCWDAGDRGRELAFHLMFLCWYLLFEPPYLTGLEQDNPICKRLQQVFNEVHDHFNTTLSGDAEMLYIVGLMAHLTPYLLGNLDVWESRSKRYQLLYRELAPEGIDPKIFEGRGAYGDYFAGQARVKDGY